MTRVVRVIAAVAASAGMLLWPVLAPGQGDYPNRPIKLDRRLRAGRLHRHRGAHRRAKARRAPRPAGGRGKQGRRRWDDRRGRHGQGARGRLHPHARHDQHARDRGGRVFEAALRSGEGFRAHLAGRDHAVPARRQSSGAGQIARGIRHACEEPAGQAQLRVRRSGHGHASRDGDAQGRRQDRCRPYPVQRKRACRRRDSRGRRAGRVRLDAGAPAEREGQQGASARGRHVAPLARPS